MGNTAHHSSGPHLTPGIQGHPTDHSRELTPPVIFQKRKLLSAKPPILNWIKSILLYGNSIVKPC